MNRLGSSQRSLLRAHFDQRVTFGRTERRRCGHDGLTPPPAKRPALGETVPDAVVRAETAHELVELVRWAADEGIALTPRGRGTSRSGGALPLRRGVVVDFRRMNHVLGVDPAARTVTVEPGIVWKALDAELARRRLALRLYPTSYRGSTAGGWLAQGGAGIGSFEAGWFRDNVVAARIVHPSGQRDVTGPDLGLVSEAEGTTGLLTSLTLRVAPVEEIAIAAAATADPEALQELLESVIEAGVPLWSVSFVDPGLAALGRRALTRSGETPTTTPEEYVVTFAFPRSRAPWVVSSLPWIVNDARAWLLDDDLARREWDSRFRTERVRRLPAPFTPGDVVVPLGALSQALMDMDLEIGQVPREAVVVQSPAGGAPEVAIHAWLPGDGGSGAAREPALADALSLVRIAERHGGRPYSTGLYFRDRSARVLGADRARAIEDFKRRVDPGGILNPGKVIGRVAVRPADL